MNDEKLVRDLMTSNVITFFAEQNLPIAEDIMRFKRIRHIPVIDDDRNLVGLVTHRDILKAQVSPILASGAAARAVNSSIQVSEIMTTDVWTVSPDATALDAGRLLLDHAFSCLPVTEDGKLVGILTDRDYLKFALDGLERFS